MKRRILSLLLALVMLVGIAPTGAVMAAAEGESKFVEFWGAQLKKGESTMRFVGVVDDYEAVQELGFSLEFALNKVDCHVTKVYTSIEADGKTQEAGGGTFFTLCVTDLPKNTVIEAQSYYMKKGDAEKTYGAVYAFKYTGTDVVGIDLQSKDYDSSAEDTTTFGDLLDPVDSIGGIKIADIKQVAYHGEDLRESAERIANKLKSLGNSEVAVFAGSPTRGTCAIELGFADGDKRLAYVEEDEAVVSSNTQVIVAAVKGNNFSKAIAANMLERYIGSREYKYVFTERVQLTFSVKATNEDAGDIGSQTGTITMNGDTTKNPLNYSVGELITFNVNVVRNGQTVKCASLFYQLDCDDGQSTFGTVENCGGLELTTVLATPGYARLRVTAQDGNGTQYEGSVIFEGGAGADIQKLEQSIAEPDDFDEFWAAQLKALNAYDVTDASNVTITDMPETDTHYAYDIQIACGGSMPASGVLTVPKNAAEGSLNAKIIFQAHSNTPKASDPVYDNNAIVFSVNPHGVLNYGQDESYYTNYGAQIGDFGFDSKQNADPETSYFLGMILRDVQAARYLISLPEYNGKGLIFDNGSMGAMQAINVANLIGADNVKELNLKFPWLSNFGCASVGLMGPFWGPPVTATTAGVAEIVEMGTLYFDPVNHAKRITAKVTITSCLGDYVCPPSGQTVLYKAFASANKTMIFKQNCTHGYNSPHASSYEISW